MSDDIAEKLIQLQENLRKDKENFDNSALGKTISLAKQRAPKLPRDQQYMLKEHTDVCPKTGKPYSTREEKDWDDSPPYSGIPRKPVMPLTTPQRREICESCGMVIYSEPQFKGFYS